MDINLKDRSVSIAEAVFNSIEKDILDGRLTSGEILTELKLCEMLNVSRTPVREALKRLRQEGMVKESGKGAVVIGITQKDIEDIYLVRLSLEGVACEMCCANISQEGIKELENTLELQEFYIMKNNTENARNLDNEFHRKIYEYSQSRIICDILTDLHRKSQRFRLASMQDPVRSEEVIEEHRAILTAIKHKDGNNAKRLITQHISNAYTRIKETNQI